jgi:site-specific recombinase XerD
MDTKLSVLFHGKRTKSQNASLLAIYLRVTVDGQRMEISTKRIIEKDKWSSISGKAKDNLEEARNLNAYLDLLRNKVYNYQREIIREDKPVTLEQFRNKWNGITEKPRMILEVFQEHNEQVAALVGKGFAAGTLERYITSLKHTRSFIQWKFQRDDLPITALNYEFMSQYAFWFRSVRNCDHNTTMKYLANFKKIVIICLKNGWLSKDPFYGFKLARKEVMREFLTDEELGLIRSKYFSMERISQVRDIFLFSCYTGLAYADVKKLKRSEIGIGVDGEKWIFTSRQKTDTLSRIPLLTQAIEILDRYKSYPSCDNADRLLPVLSNQKMNAYLKEIADCCGIRKPFTYHTARHTFATTITLSNGVPIETVSKMLGHRNLKTTQHYVKILDKKVSEDMRRLKEKLAVH